MVNEFAIPMPPAERDASRTRILRIITRLNIGGPAIQAITLSSRLDASGFGTTLNSEETECPAKATCARCCHYRLVMRYIHALPTTPDQSPQRRDNVVALLTLMRRIRPAIVHTHMAKAGAIGRLAAMAYNAGPGRHRPAHLVHTYHGHVLEGVFFGSRDLGISSTGAATRPAEPMHYVAVSPAVRREFPRGLRIGNRDRFHVVPLGFNLDALAAIDDAARVRAKVDLDIAAGAPVVTWVGRLTAISPPLTFPRR